MTTVAKWSIRIAFVGVVIAAIFFSLQHAASAKSDTSPQRVRWLLSHQPTDVFARATTVFAEELSKGTDGRLVLEVVMPEELGYANTGDIPNADVLKYLDEGRVELATTYTVGLGKADPALWALNLPFLFQDYGSAGDILDGEIGAELMATVAENTNTHALAFTMSGGFRLFASKVPVRNPTDLKGKRIATSGGPVAEATISALGAIPVSTDLESAQRSIDTASIDAIETTYSRLSAVVGSNTAYTTHIAETNHSLFLTVILASDTFFSSLSAADQSALRAAAIAAAKVEREDSILLGEQTTSRLKEGGVDIATFGASQRDAMKASTKDVYTNFVSEYGATPLGNY